MRIAHILNMMNKRRKTMFGLISKKKLYKKLEELYFSNHTSKSDGTTTGDRKSDYYFNCGCANVCNALCTHFGLPSLNL